MVVSSKFKKLGNNIRRAFSDKNPGPSPPLLDGGAPALEPIPSARNSLGTRDTASSATTTTTTSMDHLLYPKFPTRCFVLISQSVSAPADSPVVTKYLTELCTILQCKRFYFKTPGTKQRARKSFLSLWNLVLTLVKINSNSQSTVEIYHRILEALLDRREFCISPETIDNSISHSNKREEQQQQPFTKNIVLLPSEEHEDDGEDDNQNYHTSSPREAPFHSNTSTTSSHTIVQPKELEESLSLYRRRLYDTFKYATSRMQTSTKKTFSSSSAETLFFARVLAVSFARVPVIQDVILSKVLQVQSKRVWHSVPTHDESKKCKWAGPTFAQALGRWSSSHGLDFHEVSHFRQSVSRRDSNMFYDRNPTLFGWSDFDPYLELDMSNADLKTEIQKNENGWLNKIVSDGEFFFFIVANLSEHIKSVVDIEGTEDIDIIWTEISGYGLMMHTALCLLKEACWRQWWDLLGDDEKVPAEEEENEFLNLSTRGVKSVMKNSSKLLCDVDLINTMVLGLYEGTNLTQSKSVGLTLHSLENWLSAISVTVTSSDETSQRCEIPSSFNGSVLSLGIKPMIWTENAKTLKKVLLFLYKRMDFFNGELRQGILKSLLSRHFALFLHWNNEVRSYYQHLLVYKIAKIPRKMLGSVTDSLLLDLDKSSESNSEQDVIKYSMDYYTDRAHWKAFDACISLTCIKERQNAKACHQQYQMEREFARNRSFAFESLSTEVPEAAGPGSMNEGRPGGTTSSNIMEELEDTSSPPYYLRYLPQPELEALQDCCSILSVGYSDSLQVYAKMSLQSYTRMLEERYEQEELFATGQIDEISTPALGFC